MKKAHLVVLALASIALGIGSAVLLSQEDPKERLMAAKSGYAHRLLDAIIEEDFETIRDQAFRLKAVAETADWNVVETPQYVRQSDAFIHATDRLVEAARNENGDAAALAYMDITLKCVHCHRYLRSYTPN